MTKHRILVCGGRDYNDKRKVFKTLDKYCLDGGFHDQLDKGYWQPRVVIIQGGATGADSLAESWCCRHDVEVERYYADWKTHGNAAGPIRNKKMLDKGKPDVVIAFPGGRGTANMVKLAKEAGVKVVEVEE